MGALRGVSSFLPISQFPPAFSLLIFGIERSQQEGQHNACYFIRILTVVTLYISFVPMNSLGLWTEHGSISTILNGNGRDEEESHFLQIDSPLLAMTKPAILNLENNMLSAFLVFLSGRI
jgi:hypothetical protein